MKNNSILISIVTVVYNGEEFIEKTIKSVLSQSYKNIEFIVVDGCSKDLTMDVVAKYKDSIDIVISEEDEGIYDAMNKGVTLANGDFINFMNGGDTFNDNFVLENLVKNIIDMKKIYFARANITEEKLSWLYPNHNYNHQNIDIWLKKALPNHQAMFFPKVFYKNYKYDLNYKIGSDSDYKFKAQQEFGFEFIDIVACKFELGGVSSSFNDFKRTKQILVDSFKISIKYKGLFYALDRCFKILSKYILNKFLTSQIFLYFHHKIKG